MKRIGALFLIGLFACGGGGKKAVKGGESEASAEGEDLGVPPIDTTRCQTSGKKVSAFDLNRDSKPDFWEIFDGSVQSCRQIDYDHEGTKDHILTFDKSGRLVAEELDFDNDGKFEATFHYEGTAVTMVERDSDHNGRSDVWEKYDGSGALTSVRRDRNNDRKPDVWESWAGGQMVSARYDDDFDTKVDRKEEGGPAPAPAPAPETPPAEPAPEPTKGG